MAKVELRLGFGAEPGFRQLATPEKLDLIADADLSG